MRKFIPLVVTAAFVYWGFYLRAAGASNWVFAPEAVTDLLVRPGDATGLSFSLGRTVLKPKDVQPRD